MDESLSLPPSLSLILCRLLYLVTGRMPSMTGRPGSISLELTLTGADWLSLRVGRKTNCITERARRGGRETYTQTYTLLATRLTRHSSGGGESILFLISSRHSYALYPSIPHSQGVTIPPSLTPRVSLSPHPSLPGCHFNHQPVYLSLLLRGMKKKRGRRDGGKRGMT